VRRVQLDGLRFFLFVAIFLTHHFTAEAEFLGYALPVFFVMSGFLITKVLLAADEPGLWPKLRAFYIRRVLRIFPAYYVVVALLWFSGHLTYPLHYLAYLVNVKLFTLSFGPDLAAFGDWFGPAWQRESLQVWSLSVEEQFYLAYPLLFFTTPAARRTAVLFAVLGASILSRAWLAAAFPQTFYSALLPVCAEYLVWGCIFAWLMAQGALRRLSPRWMVALSGIGIVALIGLEFHLGMHGFFQFRTSHFQTPIAFLIGLFIWSLWNAGATHPLVRFLSWRPFVYFGEMSYTMYLTHLMSWDIYAALRGGMPAPKSAEILIGTWVVTTLMSMAIWHGVEKPMNSLKRYVGRARGREVVLESVRS